MNKRSAGEGLFELFQQDPNHFAPVYLLDRGVLAAVVTYVHNSQSVWNKENANHDLT